MSPPPATAGRPSVRRRTAGSKTRAEPIRDPRRTERALLLSEIRERAGKSQRQVAEVLGIKQPSLSKLEKQSDMQISTLRRIVNALSGELECVGQPFKATGRWGLRGHR
jgi:DNA-binding XRE family transcriptional regulator